MKYWTNKELKRLEEVSKLPGCWRLHLQDFPGRTIESLRHEASRHGWKKVHTYPGRPPTSQVKVMALLETGDMCRSEIAEQLGIRECTTSEILQRLRLAGKIFVRERLEGRGATMVWSIVKKAEPASKEATPVRKSKPRERRIVVDRMDSPVKREPTVVVVRRDPMVTALFGAAI